MHLSDAHHFRKMVAGACMVVAPLVLLAAMVIHPASDMNEATQVATIQDNLDAWYVAHLLALISIAVMVPAVLGWDCSRSRASWRWSSSCGRWPPAVAPPRRSRCWSG